MGNHIVLGFDFGTKRIGVAVGQTITRSASPLAVIRTCAGQPNWQEVNKLIDTWKPAALIVGKPLNMDGTLQLMTQAATVFAEALHVRYGLPVHAVDERLSTKAARASIFDAGGYRALCKAPIDSLAAQIILEDWLNNQ